jgi:outer membrane beta-barrel protein
MLLVFKEPFMMKRYLLIPVLILMIAFQAATASAGSPGTEENVFAVQEKMFHKYHELAFVTGYMSGDDFYQVYPVGLAYTFHFDDKISWEVARFYYNFTMDKNILDKLLDDFGAAPVEYYQPKYQLLTHLVIRPFYGKDAVLNKKVINHETYFMLGGGFDFYKKNYSDGVTPGKSETAPIISMGAGIKYFINNHVNLAVEVHDYVTYRGDEVVNNMWFGVNVGFGFNLGARPSYSDETINTLNGYLKDEQP